MSALQLGFESMSKWDAGTAGVCLTHYATVPAPQEISTEVREPVRSAKSFQGGSCAWRVPPFLYWPCSTHKDMVRRAALLLAADPRFLEAFWAVRAALSSWGLCPVSPGPQMMADRVGPNLTSLSQRPELYLVGSGEPRNILRKLGELASVPLPLYSQFFDACKVKLEST